MGVLAPNVRGSTGYGTDFTHLDDRERRLDSVRDLVEGRNWLISSGIAEDGKVAVLGGSYGGYMTLAALAFHPGLWACGVDIVGISNFRSFIATTGAWRRNMRAAEYGDPDRIGEFLDRVSPLNSAERIVAPLMVIQGKNDPRVPQSEAEQIVAAIRKRGGTVDYLLFPDEGHGLRKLPNRIKGYKAMADFLERFLLGGAVGTAPAASSTGAPAAPPAVQPAPPDVPRAPAMPASGKATRKPEPVAVIHTAHGEIVFRFFDRDAPGHAAFVRDLIGRGFYDGTTFHRVIPGFVIQGGDPNSKDADRSNDGDGEADRTLKAEFSSALHYRPGTVGMARGEDPDSGSCQFFIALTDLPRLDGRYTIFGEVVVGLDVARRIASLPRDLNDNPLQGVPMTVRIETRRLPEAIVSLDPAAGGSGEILTGPGKPKPFDPGNVLWTPPRLREGAKEGEPPRIDGIHGVPPIGGGSTGATPDSATSPAVRLELSVDENGKVLDVRFPRFDTPGAAALREAALARSFEPARLSGKPQKVRFEMDSDGARPGPPTGGGAPAEVTGDVIPPRPVLRVPVPAGASLPKDPLRFRLTVDATGKVTEAAPQGTTGEAALDERAREAALALALAPAMKSPAPGRPPEPVAVYLDIEAVFVAAP
jgi:cyclophilin family peptidyl-prolyl cis-trans isomerase/dienelactone hydrolase